MACAGRAAPDVKATDAYLDLWAELVEMRVQLAAIRQKLTDLPDYGARIRELEIAKAKAVGVCLLLATLAGSVAGWLPLVTMHH